VLVQQKSVGLPTVEGAKPSDAINVNVVKALEEGDYQYAKYFLKILEFFRLLEELMIF